MKGFTVGFGWIGFVGQGRMEFPTEQEYIEYMKEEEDGREREEE